MSGLDARLRAQERAARMGDPAAVTAAAAARARCPECEACGEHVAAVDDNAHCPPCAASVLANALAHGVVWRCGACQTVSCDGDVCDGCGDVCQRCNASGYSYSGAVMLSRGEVECDECSGTGALLGWSDEGEGECPECDGDGAVVCEHA